MEVYETSLPTRDISAQIETPSQPQVYCVQIPEDVTITEKCAKTQVLDIFQMDEILTVRNIITSNGRNRFKYLVTGYVKRDEPIPSGDLKITFFEPDKKLTSPEIEAEIHEKFGANARLPSAEEFALIMLSSGRDIIKDHPNLKDAHRHGENGTRLPLADIDHVDRKCAGINMKDINEPNLAIVGYAAQNEKYPQALVIIS